MLSKLKLYRGVVSHLADWQKLKSLIIHSVDEAVEEKGISIHCWRECKMIQSLWKGNGSI